jgi:formylglycine-generating enzyme required for sulfatase activity
MGCVTWYEAYAFCTWDGGRLPIETEWERVASGDENRVYPWGFGGPDCARVRPYDNCHEQRDIFAPVGRLAAGAGPWGHLDLAGGAKEWIRDVFDRYVIGNPAPAVRLRLPGGVSAPHVLRGLSFWGGDGDMRSADRTSSSPETRHPRNGIRCARDVSLAR